MKRSTATLVAHYLGYAFASADLVAAIDEEGRVTEALGASRHVFGIDSNQLNGRSIVDLFDPGDQALVETIIRETAQNKRYGPVRLSLCENVAPPGRRFVSFSLFRNEFAEGVKQVAVSVTGNQAATDSDGFGGLPRSNDPFDQFVTSLEDACATGLPLAFGLIEATGLAAIDLLDEGDQNLMRRQIAAKLRFVSHRAEAAIDLGDARFAVIAHGETDFFKVVQDLERTADDFGVALSVSQQSTILPTADGAKAAMAVLRHAINHVVKLDKKSAPITLTDALRMTIDLSASFSKMVHNGDFELQYQPIVDLKTGAVHHYEALARLAAGESPAEVVAMAEELELVAALDLAVLHKAVAALAHGQHRGLRVAINVSAISLKDSTYAKEVQTIIRTSRVDASRLLVELTESTPLEDLDQARREIEALRLAGVEICMDDVGAGSASLDYLRTLPFDYLKLDGRFAKQALTCKRTQHVIRGLAVLGRELGAAMIAEHIENAELAELMQRQGVAFGQGWWFGRPADLPVVQTAARRTGATESWS